MARVDALSKVPVFRIGATLLAWALPLIALPLGVLAAAGLPVHDGGLFLRLLGWACLALCVGYGFALRAALRRRDAAPGRGQGLGREATNLRAKLSLFSEHWSPRVVAEMNDYQFKLAKLEGEFVWHAHEHTDEVFIVLEGALVLEFRDRAVPLAAGELFVVPRGVEHRPVAERECAVMLVEPRGVVNTGRAGGALTAANDVWV